MPPTISFSGAIDTYSLVPSACGRLSHDMASSSMQHVFISLPFMIFLFFGFEGLFLCLA
jgi:hypothetical protein